MIRQLALLCCTVALASPAAARADSLSLIDTAELKALAAGAPDTWSFTLVDARTRVEFSESHIVGALNIPAGEVAQRLPELVKDKARLVVFYCNGPRCTKSARAGKAAQGLGYSKVREYQEGLPAWGMARLPLEGKPLPAFEVPLVSPKDLAAALQRPSPPLLVDIRDPSEFEAWHVAGARNVPIDELAARVKELPADRTLCLVDHIGHQTPVAGRQLASLGRTRLQRLDGGVLAWKSAGLPVEARR